jgi:hypothetical protein
MKTKAEEFNKLACQLGYDTGESLVDAMKKNDRIEKHAGYCQAVEMTREEKIAMYMRLTKMELIEMLLLNQELLTNQIGHNNSYKHSWPDPPSYEGVASTSIDLEEMERGLDKALEKETKKLLRTLIEYERPVHKHKTPYDLNRGGFRKGK